jgi:hypothetical protein
MPLRTHFRGRCDRNCGLDNEKNRIQRPDRTRGDRSYNNMAMKRVEVIGTLRPSPIAPIFFDGYRGTMLPPGSHAATFARLVARLGGHPDRHEDTETESEEEDQEQ